MLRSSVLIFLAAATVSMAQPALAAKTSGRFAFRKIPALPGFKLTSAGFAANSVRSDSFQFAQAAKSWQASGVSSFGATYLLGGSGRSPDKLRVNLLSPGFELHFQGGFGFSCSSNLSPFVSWGEGSIGPGVPAPKSTWFLISFQESQPPILIAFPGTAASIKLSGKPGAWRIESVGVYQGWMRIALPVGTKSIATTDAASLGQMVVNFKKHQAFWTAPAPSLASQETKIEKDALTVTWHFTRPYAVLPYPAIRASKLGFKVAPLTKIAVTGVETEEGPTAYSVESKLAVRFPRVAIPPGRAVVSGDPRLPAAASPLDVSSLLRVAFAARLANTPEQVIGQGSGLTEDFLSVVRWRRDPVSGQEFPFDTAGAGLDLVAAHALVSAAVGGSENLMAETLGGTIDWLTWRPWPNSHSAAALGALGGWLSEEPEFATTGCLLEAGLVADKAVAPLDSIRKSAYGRQLEGMPEDRWVRALRSPLRWFGPGPLVARAQTGGYLLKGQAGAQIDAQTGMALGNELLRVPEVHAGWSRYALAPSGSASLPLLPSPLVGTPEPPAWK